MTTHEKTLITRRTGLGLMLAGLLGTAGRAGAADGIEQSKIIIGGVRDSQIGIQLMIASTQGYFKDEGLDVDVAWTESGSDILSMIVGGVYQIATSSVTSELVATGRGVPVKVLTALSNYSGTQGLVLSPGVKLASPKDLVGKRLASPKSSPHIMMLAKLAKQYGFDASKVELVSMEPADAVVAAARGDVDGALTYEPFMSRLVDLGGSFYVTGTTSYVTGEKQALPLDDLYLYLYGFLIAHEDWIDKNPNTIKALLRALVRANDVINNDRPRALSLVQDFLHIDEATASTILSENSYGLALDDGVVRSINLTSEWLQIAKRIPGPIAPADVLAPKLLQEVNPALVSYKL